MSCFPISSIEEARRRRRKNKSVLGESKEDIYAEQPAIDWLEELGWTSIHGPNIAPDGPAPEREYWSEVVLRDRLRAKVAELNPDLPEEAIGEVITRAAATEFTEPIDDHNAFHKLLRDGIPVT